MLPGRSGDSHAVPTERSTAPFRAGARPAEPLAGRAQLHMLEPRILDPCCHPCALKSDQLDTAARGQVHTLPILSRIGQPAQGRLVDRSPTDSTTPPPPGSVHPVAGLLRLAPVQLVGPSEGDSHDWSRPPGRLVHGHHQAAAKACQRCHRRIAPTPLVIKQRWGVPSVTPAADGSTPTQVVRLRAPRLLSDVGCCAAHAPRRPFANRIQFEALAPAAWVLLPPRV